MCILAQKLNSIRFILKLAIFQSISTAFNKMAFKRGKKGRKVANKRKPMNYRTGGYQGLELKYFDTTKSITTIGADWATSGFDPDTILCLSAPGQGDGANERIGRKITIHSVEVTGRVRLIADDTVASPPSSGRNVRLILVVDKQTNQTALASGGLVISTFGSGQQEYGHRNLEHIKRFKVLADLWIQLDWTASNGISGSENYVGQSKVFHIKRTMKMPVIFTDGDGDIASVSDNSIHMLAVTNGVVSELAADYVARIRFTG